jgi:hypothetical protein
MQAGQMPPRQTSPGQTAPGQAPPALIRLHDLLHLSPDQEAAWNAYAAAVSPTPEAEQRQMAAAELLPQLTTPRRIALIDASMTQDAADFHRQGQAVMSFYMRLSPAQQRTFDQETLPPASDGSRPMEAEPSRTAPNQPLRMPPNP